MPKLTFILAKRSSKARALDRAWGRGCLRRDAVWELPCITTGGRLGRSGCGMLPNRTHIEASHARARGMGNVKGSYADLVPHCPCCHDWYGRDPEGYKKATGVDPVVVAAQLKARFDRSKLIGPEPCHGRGCDQYDGHSIMCPTMEAKAWHREQAALELAQGGS